MKKTLVLAALVAASVNVNAFDVKTKFAQTCGVCHTAGVAGAPKAFDAAAWAPRLKTGMPALINTVKTGKGAMPPKGMCMDCTDDQYKQLIEHMSKAQ